LGTAAISLLDEAPSCPLVSGMQSLRAMPRLQAIAHIITHQTEWWNGNGIPAGIAYDAIPLESRILGLLAYFEHRFHQLAKESPDSSSGEIFAQVLADCQAAAGERWDPKLVETLSLLVMGLQQGLSLSITFPKVTSGMWLLDV
jgi:HD-GYP domain-containing protein (c-di-GMP phosphodiesterase class II)